MSVYVPAELRRQVRARFDDRCAYGRTAEDLSVAIFELEHITPHSAGGETALDNLCLSCPTCNRYKATRTGAIDPDTQKEVALFHPHRNVWSDHFRWSADGTEIVGRTPVGRATVGALKMNRPQLLRVRRLWAAMGVHPPGKESAGDKPG